MSHENEELSVQNAMEEALEGGERAADLRRFIAILVARFEGLKADFKSEDDETQKNRIKRELKKVAEQISVLSEEAQIAEFVEDAVRVGIEMRKLEN